MGVYNITSRATFEEIKQLREKIKRAKEKDVVPIVVAGNKCDLRDPADDSQVQEKELTDLGLEWECPVFETSAEEKVNNDACFYAVVKEIRRMEAKSETQSNKTRNKWCNI